MKKRTLVGALCLSALACTAAEAPVNQYHGRRISAESVPVEVKGATFQRDLVKHPGAVVVLPVLADGRVVMIRNYRFAVGETLWELPAGTLEKGEDPAHAALRELEEETGYQAKTLTPMVQCYSSPGFCTELYHIFVAKDLTEAKQQLEETEQITVHLLTLKELDAMRQKGEIRDAKTLVALQTYARSVAVQ